MGDATSEPDEPLLDPVSVPRNGQGAIDEVERLRRERARFSCLGLGCVPWAIALAAAAMLWLLLR